MKTQIKAEIVADSLSPQGDRLTSLLITFPRIILAEVNTHRMLSKNTSSSRAIPFKKMVESVENDPFIPIAWQKPHKGMQGTEYYDPTLIEEVGGLDYTNLPRRWLRARDTAVSMAKIMADEKGNMPVTKQLCNRLLEPFMWTTMLITGSKEGWDNFFELRCPQYHAPENSIETKGRIFKSKKDMIQFYINNDFKIGAGALKLWTPIDWLKINKGQAEIHIMDLAEKIYDAMNESTPEKLDEGMWHIPFSNTFDMGHFADITNGIDYAKMVNVSTAMAARTSYTTVGDEKEVDYEKMINLHDRLIAQNPPHSSPMEHCARAMSDPEYYSFVKGESVSEQRVRNRFTNRHYGWCNNFKGFIQYRYLIEI